RDALSRLAVRHDEPPPRLAIRAVGRLEPRREALPDVLEVHGRVEVERSASRPCRRQQMSDVHRHRLVSCRASRIPYRRWRTSSVKWPWPMVSKCQARAQVRREPARRIGLCQLAFSTAGRTQVFSNNESVGAWIRNMSSNLRLGSVGIQFG